MRARHKFLARHKPSAEFGTKNRHVTSERAPRARAHSLWIAPARIKLTEEMRIAPGAGGGRALGAVVKGRRGEFCVKTHKGGTELVSHISNAKICWLIVFV
jgi:hypothetical protein